MDLTPEMMAALAKMQGGATEAASASANQPTQSLESRTIQARQKAGVGRRGGDLLDTFTLTPAYVQELGELGSSTNADGAVEPCYTVAGMKYKPRFDGPAQAGDTVEIVKWMIDGAKYVVAYLYR